MSNDLAPAVAAYREMSRRIRRAARIALTGQWVSLTSWSDDAADDFVIKVLPTVLAAQKATASATGAYLSQVTGSKVVLDFDAATGAAVRSGADPAEVYRRPFTAARVQFAKRIEDVVVEEAVQSAVDVGLRQLMGQLEFDVQRSASLAGQQALKQSKVETYRTVTRPGACALCIVAAGNTYTTAQLQPIHTNCHCVIVPGSKVPASLQGKRLIDDRQWAQGEAQGRALVVDDHPELGPVLNWEEAKAELAERRKRRPRPGTSSSGDAPPSRVPWTSRRSQVELQIRQIEERLPTITDEARPWNEQRLADLKAELATLI